MLSEARKEMEREANTKCHDFHVAADPLTPAPSIDLHLFAV